MRLTIMSDLHLHHKAPMNRKDPYTGKCLDKLRQLCSHAASTDGLVLGGDIFHVPSPPTWFINEVIAEFKKCSVPVFAVAGNHDMIGGSLEKIKDTAIWNLHLSGCLELSKGKVGFKDDTNIAFTSFGESPEKPLDGCYNILLCHIPVFESTVPFYLEGHAHTANSIKELYPGFDLYACGDIHEPFYKNKVLVTGSMMRMTIAQRDFKPRFYVLDTIEDTVEPVFFDIETDVWRDVTEQVADEEYKEALTELADAMRERDERLDYPTVCRSLAADNPKYEGMIQTLINEHGGKV